MLRHVSPCIFPSYQLYFAQIRFRSRFKGKKQKQFDKVIWEYQNVPTSEEFEPGEFLPRRLTYKPDIPKMYAPGRRKKPWIKYAVPDVIMPRELPGKEYNEVAEYPDLIKDPIVHFFSGMRYRLDWYDKIRKLPTAEQKILEIITQKRHKCCRMYSTPCNVGHLPSYQYVTRTHLIQNQLPDIYNEIEVPESVVQSTLPLLKDLIESTKIKHTRPRNYYKDTLPHRLVSQRHDPALTQINFTRELNLICTRALIETAPYLLDSHVGLDAMCRSWWYAANMMIPENSRFYKSRKENFEQPILYSGSFDVQVRMPEPIKPIIPENDPLITNGDVPYYPYSPAKLGYRFYFGYWKTLPGYFPSHDVDPKNTVKPVADFPFLTIDNCLDLRKFDEKYKLSEALCAKAIMVSFAYLNSLASYHGFTNFDGMTYPLVNQHITTNGEIWHFSVYQLNNHRFHSDFSDTRNNICWTKDMSNESLGDILTMVFKMMLNKPVLDPNVVYRPYLSADVRTEEQKVSDRTILRERFSDFHARGIKKILAGMKIFPYEWLYFRNPALPNNVTWRKLPKTYLRHEKMRGRLFK